MSEYCKHFIGTVGKECAAGVNMRELVGGPDEGWKLCLPCNMVLRRMNLDHFADRPTKECERYEPEEGDIVDLSEEIELFEKVEPLIAELKDWHKGKTKYGVIDCPICGVENGIDYKHSRSGKVVLRCKTSGCVAMVE